MKPTPQSIGFGFFYARTSAFGNPTTPHLGSTIGTDMFIPFILSLASNVLLTGLTGKPDTSFVDTLTDHCHTKKREELSEEGIRVLTLTGSMETTIADHLTDHSCVIHDVRME